MSKYRVRVLADATVYKSVVVEATNVSHAMRMARDLAEDHLPPWQLTDPIGYDPAYIGDPENDVELLEPDKPIIPYPPAGWVRLSEGETLLPGWLVYDLEGWKPGDQSKVGEEGISPYTQANLKIFSRPITQVDPHA